MNPGLKTDTASHINRNMVLALILAALVPLLTGALLSWHTLGELDVWLHQKAGLDILHEHEFPQTNTYSFTEPGSPWINHEWLFQVLVASTGPKPNDLLAGIDRWVVLRTLLSLILLGLLVFSDKPWQRDPKHLLWLAPGILLGVFLLWTRLLLRPELLSYAFMILIIKTAESPISTPSNSHRRTLFYSRETRGFLLTVLWAQIHGFSAISPVLWFLGGLLGYISSTNLPRLSIKRLFAGTFLLVIALLLTPNGWNGLVYPIKALSQFSTAEVDVQSSISELRPLFESSNSLYLTIVAFKISLIWALLLIILSWQKLSLLRVVFWVLTAWATIEAQRNIGLYAVAFTLLHTGNSGFTKLKIPGILKIQSNSKFKFGKSLTYSRSILLPLPILFTLAMASWLCWGIISDNLYLTEGQSRRFGTGPTPGRFPFESAQLLASSPDSKVFANIDAASLSLSRGKAKVFIDGRTEVYSAKTWLKYQDLHQGQPNSTELLNKAGVQKVLLTLANGSFHKLLKILLQTPGWKVQHAEPSGVLLTRDNLTHTPSPAQLVPFSQIRLRPSSGPTSKTRQADHWIARATLAELAGLSLDQERYLRQGLSLSPNHPRINHNLGNLLLQKNQTEAAFIHFEKAFKKNPRLGGSYLNAGVCQMNLGKYEAAAKLFAQAVHLQPDNYQVWANYSLALQGAGHNIQAVAAMSKAVRLSPQNTQLRTALQKLRSTP